MISIELTALMDNQANAKNKSATGKSSAMALTQKKPFGLVFRIRQSCFFDLDA